jgi:diguanylate cyclase (GGDEF)-like protein
VQDQAGLDWVIAVAVPRSDFLSGITSNLKITVTLALVLALLIVATGFGVLGAVTKDIRQLIQLTRDVGNGVVRTDVNVLRSDELGELAQSFVTMQRSLLTDRLTGIANREAFLRHVEEQIIERRRGLDQRSFGLLFIDLNGFKAINDKYGHEAGDTVLRIVSERMQSALRSEDFLARFAGDEFLVMIDGVASRTDGDSVRALLERKLSEPVSFELGEKVVNTLTGAAIGLAIYPQDGRDVETLIQFADAAMYQVKRARPLDGV